MNKTGNIKTLVGKVKIELVEFRVSDIIKDALIKEYELIVKPVMSSREVIAEEIEIYKVKETQS